MTSSYVCPNAGGRALPASMSQRALRGHVTAVEQSGPDRLAGMFPCPLEDLPEYISVVLLSEAGDNDRLRQLASQTRALRVRCSDWVG